MLKPKINKPEVKKVVKFESREQVGMRLAKYRFGKLKKRLESIARLRNYPIGDVRINKLCAMLDAWTNETKILLRSSIKEDRVDL